MINRIQKHLNDNITIKQQLLGQPSILEAIVGAGELMAKQLKNGHKILSCGNGGSACDSQHFSSELQNRFERERPPLAAIALTTDTPTLTAISNDYSYDDVFAKQLQALGQQGDLLLAISTSGHSTNICQAIKVAQQKEIITIALTGKLGGKVAKLLQTDDIEIRTPETTTARTQEVHLFVIHCLCDIIDNILYGH